MISFTVDEKEKIKAIRNEYGISLYAARRIFEKRELQRRIKNVDLNDTLEVKNILFDMMEFINI